MYSFKRHCVVCVSLGLGIVIVIMVVAVGFVVPFFTCFECTHSKAVGKAFVEGATRSCFSVH